MVDDTTAHVLAGWFQCEEVTVVKLLLRIVEILVLHGDLVNGVGAPGQVLRGRCGSGTLGDRMEMWRDGVWVWAGHSRD